MNATVGEEQAVVPGEAAASGTHQPRVPEAAHRAPGGRDRSATAERT